MSPYRSALCSSLYIFLVSPCPFAVGGDFIVWKDVEKKVFHDWRHPVFSILHPEELNYGLEMQGESFSLYCFAFSGFVSMPECIDMNTMKFPNLTSTKHSTHFLVWGGLTAWAGDGRLRGFCNHVTYTIDHPCFFGLLGENSILVSSNTYILGDNPLMV